LPEQRVAVEEVASRYGLTPMQVKVFRRYHKLGEVRRDPGGGLIDLLRAAIAGLEGLRGREKQVRYVVHARTFPSVVPYPLHPVHDLCREFGLAQASAFSVGHHACASGLFALDVVGRLLAADPDPDALALVVAGEKTFTAEAEILRDTTFHVTGCWPMPWTSAASTTTTRRRSRWRSSATTRSCSRTRSGPRWTVQRYLSPRSARCFR